MKSHERLSAYRIMWLIVIFDLPVASKRDRKNYARFRKNLLTDGFTMMQFSVYLRFCASGANATVHIGRVNGFLPPKGQVSILQITDKQYSNIINFWEADVKRMPEGPRQLELF